MILRLKEGIFPRPSHLSMPNRKTYNRSAAQRIIQQSRDPTMRIEGIKKGDPVIWCEDEWFHA